jgi:hypothetical protein
MRNRRELSVFSTSASAFVFLLAGMSVFAIHAVAQAPPGLSGETAIYQGPSSVVNSQAIVDASVLYPAQGDICGVINYILTNASEFQCGGQNNPKGVIIDARGIIPQSGSTLQCNSNPFAPTCGTTHNNPISGDQLSSTILLPALTIEIQQPWTIPSHTRVIGESENLTVLQACKANSQNCSSSFTGDMIDMGTSPCGNDCQGVGIEHLTLDGNSQAVNGIVNNDTSEELSYVNDVALLNIGGTGLLIKGSATNPGGTNSGPYSNIYYSGAGTCANINGTKSTRGIHGLTCVTTNSSGPLVFIDGSNNSIEDLTLTYVPSDGPAGPSLDGILVGSLAAAQSNVLINISGNNLANVVHVSNATSTQSNCPPQNTNNSATVNNVCDLTLLGIGSASSNAIKDDLTSTILTDATVGLYVVGEQVFAGTNSVGYSRFTTSPNLPTWLIGSGTPGSSCATGSLYSNTQGPISSTLSTCVATAWKTVQ